MNDVARLALFAGALSAGLGVLLGAFGAHALKTRLPEDLLAVWHTGVQYQVYHALGLLLLGVLAQQLPGIPLLKLAAWLMLAGTLLFSGSLYALALTGIRGLGAITPLGGLAFIAAWLSLALGVWRAA